MKQQRGFSLIELLVVVSIIAVIVTLALPNYLGSRQRTRDAKRKLELGQMKNALRLYYNDYGAYPADSGGVPYYTIKGCKTDHVSPCPCDTSIDFASGASCDSVYMKKFPSEWGSRIYYYQLSSDDFLLKVALENASDQDAAASRARCPGSGSKTCNAATADYCVCAD